MRIGTNEAVRRGVGVDDMPELADLLARALAAVDAASLADEVTAFRRRFTGVHFVR